MGVECDPGLRVRLLRHNDGLGLVVAAIKTSAGKVREKGLDYYLTEYARRKPERAVEWLREAAEKYPSVLEHWVFTFFIEGCSRACTHQLVRHRLASYTMESQRYSVALALDSVPREYRERYASQGEYRALAEWLRSLAAGLSEDPARLDEAEEAARRFIVVPPGMATEARRAFLASTLRSLADYAELLALGVPAEDARLALPQAVRTRLIATANLREWLHIVRLRGSRHAQWEIRCLAHRIARLINEAVGAEIARPGG